MSTAAHEFREASSKASCATAERKLRGNKLNCVLCPESREKNFDQSWSYSEMKQHSAPAL